MDLKTAIGICETVASAYDDEESEAIRVVLECVRGPAMDASLPLTRQYHAEYNAWKSMKRRCLMSNSDEFPYYGARGVTVCDRWVHDFAAFFADVGPRPSFRHSIDRIDTNGHYEPANVKWSTKQEQQANRRTVRKLTMNGESLCASEWARRTGINEGTIDSRKRAGWSDVDALTRPVAPGPKRGGRARIVAK